MKYAILGFGVLLGMAVGVEWMKEGWTAAASTAALMIATGLAVRGIE